MPCASYVIILTKETLNIPKAQNFGKTWLLLRSTMGCMAGSEEGLFHISFNVFYSLNI